MPNSLQVVKQENFGTVQCNFLRNESGEIFMTREQIGKALEYDNPMIAVAKIHDRHPDRINKFSVLTKLVNTHDGKLYDTYIYSTKGVYEICRFSRQPKADAFMDWVWDVVESIRKTGTYIPPNANAMLEGLQKAQDLTDKLLSAGVSPAAALETTRGIYKSIGINIPRLADPIFYTAQEISEYIGLHCNKKAYNNYVIEHIISCISVEKHEVRSTYDIEDEIIVKKYSESIIFKVEAWLSENNYPPVIACERNGRPYLYEVGYTEKKAPIQKPTVMLQPVQTMDSLPAALNVDDVKSILGIGRVQAYNLVRQSGFPLLRVGRRLLIPKDRFFAWLNKSVERSV